MHPSLVLATLTGTVVSGLLLRSAQLVPQGAAATLLSLCCQLTLPALLLHTLPPALDAALDAPFFALLPAIGVAHLLAVTAFCALFLRRQRPADRALALGCLLSPDVAACSFPVLEAVFGSTGLTAAALLAVPASLGIALAAPCVFALGRLAGAGAPDGERAPGQRVHLEGGVYDGQWFEGAKDGSGVYVYTSGAKYEGQWRGNQKHGRGVYTWPKGGAYAGEWRGGQRCGLGARTFKDGSKAPSCGRWEGDKLVESMSTRDVDVAVEGALQAAAAARETAADAAPGSLRGVITSTALAPACLAVVASLLIFSLDLVLPTHLTDVIAHLAAGHRPLLLLSLGVALADGGASLTGGDSSATSAPGGMRTHKLWGLVAIPPPPQLRAVLATLVLKYVTSLVLVAGLTAAMGFNTAARTVPHVALTTAVACALLAPVSPVAVHNAAAQRNAAMAAAPLVAGASLGLSAMCWAVLGSLHTSGVAASHVWAVPAAALGLAAACYLLASVAAAWVAPRRMRTTKAAFEAATSQTVAQVVGWSGSDRWGRRQHRREASLPRWRCMDSSSAALRLQAMPRTLGQLGRAHAIARHRGAASARSGMPRTVILRAGHVII